MQQQVKEKSLRRQVIDVSSVQWNGDIVTDLGCLRKSVWTK